MKNIVVVSVIFLSIRVSAQEEATVELFKQLPLHAQAESDHLSEHCSFKILVKRLEQQESTLSEEELVKAVDHLAKNAVCRVWHSTAANRQKRLGIHPAKTEKQISELVKNCPRAVQVFADAKRMFCTTELREVHKDMVIFSEEIPYQNLACEGTEEFTFSGFFLKESRSLRHQFFGGMGVIDLPSLSANFEHRSLHEIVACAAFLHLIKRDYHLPMKAYDWDSENVDYQKYRETDVISLYIGGASALE